MQSRPFYLWSVCKDTTAGATLYICIVISVSWLRVRSRFLNYQCHECMKWNYGWLNWPIYAKSVPRCPNLCLFSSMANHFRDTRFLKIGEVGNVPNDLRLTVKSTWYTRSNYPRGPDLGPFCSMTCPFRDTRLFKIGKSKMHRMTSKWHWTLNSQKYLAHANH